MKIKNVRFIIAAITTFSAYAVYVSRVNLSIAIIAMVDDRHSAGSTTSSSQQQQQHQQHKLVERQATSQENYANVASVTNEPWNLPPSSPLTSLDEMKNNRSSPPEATVHASSLDPPSHSISATTTTTLDTTQAKEHQLASTSSASNSTTTSSTIKPNQQFLDVNNIFLTSKKSFNAPLISQEKFHWDQTEQGHIMGAFFYGYIIFQIPGARMAESVGAKWIIMAASAGSAVISLAFPLSTQLNSIHLLMVLRFVMGLCQSAFFPAAYVIFCRWLPEKERSILLPIMFIGSNMGSISTYILSSYLISSNYGWPSVFYLSGLVCSLCSLLWFIFGSNGPEDNWFITEKEILFIERNVNNQSSESNSLDEQLQQQRATLSNNSIPANIIIDDVGKFDKKLQQKQEYNNQQTTSVIKSSCKDCCQQRITDHNNNSLVLVPSNIKHDDDCLKARKSSSIGGGSATAAAVGRTNVTPDPDWSKLLKSGPVWILIFSMYGNEWSNAVICYELPTYLNSALNFPIEQNGVINSFFQLSYAVASPIMSSMGAYMLDRHLFGMRKIHVRKLFQSLATFGQLACFVSVPICGANRGLIIMFMFLAIVFKSCANAGDIMVSGDLSPEYAGTIFAFANSIGNTAGVLVPALAGMLVNDAYQREQWTPFWLITAGLMCFSGLIFLVFGETRRQDFSLDKDNNLNNNEKISLSTLSDINCEKSRQKSQNNKLQQQMHPELMECCQKDNNKEKQHQNLQLRLNRSFT